MSAAQADVAETQAGDANPCSGCHGRGGAMYPTGRGSNVWDNCMYCNGSGTNTVMRIAID
jgi:DnaJ-class molecular chaperone